MSEVWLTNTWRVLITPPTTRKQDAYQATSNVIIRDYANCLVHCPQLVNAPLLRY